MPGISTSIKLNDRMTEPLKAIMNAVNMTTSTLYDMSSSMDGLNSSSLDGMLQSVNEANVKLEQMEQGINSNTVSQHQFNDALEEGTAGMNALEGAAKKVVTAIGGMFAIQKVVGFIQDCTEAASTQNAAETQLATTLMNMGGTESDYDAIVQKAQEIQQMGIYGDEAMIGAAAEFATYMSDTSAVELMMDTLTDYAAGMSGGGAIDYDSMVNYATNLGKITTGSYDAMTKKGFEFTDAQKAVIDGSATQLQYLEVLGEGWEDMSEDMRVASTISEVISESWNGMYESMSQTPEAQIISLTNSFGDLKEAVGNRLNVSLGKLYSIISKNWTVIEGIMMAAANRLSVIIEILGGIINVTAQVAQFAADNWSIISAVIGTAIAVLVTYKAALLAIKAVEIAETAVKAAACIATYAHAAATGVEASATTAATAAQLGLNTALLACPITWIIALILIVIGLLYAVVAVINKVTGTTISATGIICGVVMAAIEFIGNILISAWNLIVDIIVWIMNVVQDLCDFIVNAFQNPIGAIRQLFLDLADDVLAILQALASAIDTVFGSNLSGAVQGWRDGLADLWADTYGDDVYSSDDISGEFFKFNRISGLYDVGYEFGKSVDDFFSGSSIDLGDYGVDLSSYMDSTGSSLDSIATDTSDIKDSVDISDENLKYLRDIAETEAINRFTTAEINVSMTNNNNVSGSMDIDGVVGRLSSGVMEAMQQAAEGVH